MLYPTKNDLPESTRVQMIETLNLSLADAIALQTQAKQAHWNVKGPHFIGLHKLFDDVSDAVLEYIDLIAERAVQLGGVAEGTAKMAVQRARLSPYPLDISTGKAHCEVLSSALAVFGKGVRGGIDAADAAGDKDTSDMYTEVSRGTDQWLWFIEAHLQADA
jgi:starvation-inducible DNA-binding protein